MSQTKGDAVLRPFYRVLLIAAMTMAVECHIDHNDFYADDDTSNDDDNHPGFCGDGPLWYRSPQGEDACLFRDDSLIGIYGDPINIQQDFDIYAWLFFPADVDENTGARLEEIKMNAIEIRRIEERQGGDVDVVRYFLDYYYSVKDKSGTYSLGKTDYEVSYDEETHVIKGLHLFADRAGVSAIRIAEVHGSSFYYLEAIEHPGTLFMFTDVRLSAEIGHNPFER